MAVISRATTWSDGQTLTASALNGEFNVIQNDYNGNITNANIAATAAIALTKLASTPATLTGIETLTNKTFTKPTVNGSVQGVTTDTDGATITFDMTSSNVHKVTLAGNRTLAVSNVSTGQPFIVILKQDGVGTRTVTWFGSILWAGGSTPALTTTAGKQDVFGFIYDGTNYLGFIIGQNV